MFLPKPHYFMRFSLKRSKLELILSTQPQFYPSQTLMRALLTTTKTMKTSHASAFFPELTGTLMRSAIKKEKHLFAELDSSIKNYIHSILIYTSNKCMRAGDDFRGRCLVIDHKVILCKNNQLYAWGRWRIRHLYDFIVNFFFYPTFHFFFQFNLLIFNLFILKFLYEIILISNNFFIFNWNFIFSSIYF